MTGFRPMTLALVAFLSAAAPAAAQNGIAEVLADVGLARSLYQAPLSKAQLSEMLARGLASHPGWMLLRKSGGNVCPTPYPGVEMSCDWVVFGGYGWDIVEDAEGVARIRVGNEGPIGAGTDLVTPWQVSGTTPPPPGGGTGGNPNGVATRADLQEFADGIVTRTGNQAADVIAAIDRMLGCRNGLDSHGKPCASVTDQIYAIDGRLDKIQADVNDPGFWKKLRSNPIVKYGVVVLGGVLLKQYGGALIPDGNATQAP